MSDTLNVCLIDPQPLIAVAFRTLGHVVLTLVTGKQSFFDLPQALEEQGFVPDLVVQTEILANRTVLTGLDRVACPTVFWAMDPHLNAHWHSLYARLFDCICSTQRGWIPHFRKQGVADVRWLPMFGRVEPWVDMQERAHDLAFVGRVSRQRPARGWMIEFLEAQGKDHSLAIESSLAYEDMMALYRGSRIVPNESIFGEVNFRLFEGASCGCLVLSQALGDEQEALFEPGREFDTYANIVELDEKLSMYMKNTRLVQAMGRAARERLQAEHLPRHRVERLVEYGREVGRHRACGAEAAKWQALTVVAMWEAGALDVSTQDVLARLASVEQDDDVAAALLRALAAAKVTPLLVENLNAILGARLYTESPDLNLAGSMAALRVNHWDGAKAFWYRHLEATLARPCNPPENPQQQLMLWAKELKRSGHILRAGFGYDPQMHLPATAVECLMTILDSEPEHLPTLKLLDTLLRPIAGVEPARLGYLSMLTLHERRDWRLAFEIGLANLKSYRLASGLEELRLAREMALDKGQGAVFDKALAARDGSGLLAARLD